MRVTYWEYVCAIAFQTCIAIELIVPISSEPNFNVRCLIRFWVSFCAHRNSETSFDVDITAESRSFTIYDWQIEHKHTHTHTHCCRPCLISCAQVYLVRVFAFMGVCWSGRSIVHSFSGFSCLFPCSEATFSEIFALFRFFFLALLVILSQCFFGVLCFEILGFLFCYFFPFSSHLGDFERFSTFSRTEFSTF